MATKVELEAEVETLKAQLAQSEKITEGLKQRIKELENTAINLQALYSSKTKSVTNALDTFYRYITLEFKN